MNKTKFILLIFTLVFSVCASSCGATEADVFDFSEQGATFTLVFPSEVGEITLSCTAEADSFHATVDSPERSRGITVVSSNGAVSVCAGDIKIPLTEKAARGLSCIFDVMYRGDVDATVTKSTDGEYTLITYEDGVITLDENGIPVEIDTGRVVKIRDYLTAK